jgi:small neutral amino acid transporter SnatA (MarC family)
MDFESVNATTAFDIFLLLLIGIGPKLALVPFLHVTAGMSVPTKGLVLRRMLITAGTVAVVLLVVGELLTRLLHFSTGALAIAGGIILFITAVTMVLGQDDPDARSSSLQGKDPMQLAVVPLAVPYLLNPAGIVILVTASAESTSVGVFALVVVMLVAVLALDVVVFRWANRASELLVENRMLLVEKVFGFLLAALAVELALNGLSEVGVVHLTSR